MLIAALAFARHTASLCSLSLGQGAKPVLAHAAVGSNASPSANHGPVSEERGLDLDLIKPRKVERIVRSFHVYGCHGSKTKLLDDSRSRVSLRFPLFISVGRLAAETDEHSYLQHTLGL